MYILQDAVLCTYIHTYLCSNVCSVMFHLPPNSCPPLCTPAPLACSTSLLLQLWDLREGGKCVRSLNQGRVDPDPTPIQDMIVTADGQHLFTSAGTGVLVWDLRKYVGAAVLWCRCVIVCVCVCRCACWCVSVHVGTRHECECQCICFSVSLNSHSCTLLHLHSDPHSLLSNPSLPLPLALRMTCASRLAGHSGTVQSLALGPDVILTGSRDRQIKVCMLTHTHTPHTHRPHTHKHTNTHTHTHTHTHLCTIMVQKCTP